MQDQTSDADTVTFIRLTRWVIGLGSLAGGLLVSILLFGVSAGTYGSKISSAQEATNLRITTLENRTEAIESDRAAKLEKYNETMTGILTGQSRIETKVELILKRLP